MKIPTTFSPFYLIAANSIPLIGVTFLGWNLFSIIFIYWLENLIIGFYNLLKINKASGSTPSTITINNQPAGNVSPKFISIFFTFHYGLFTLVHGIFLFAFFGPPTINHLAVPLTLFSLTISHGLSYQLNFIGRREYQRISPAGQMFMPYKRIIVMHLTIIFGAFAATALGTPVGALIVMIILKTLADLLSHLWEHGLIKPRLMLNPKLSHLN